MENSKIVNIPLDQIWDNPYQTRHAVPNDHIGNLASDIRANGLLQNPAGRPVDDNGLLIPYREGCAIQLAYGHNRHKAFYLLSGMFTGEYDAMPIKIVDYTDEQMALAGWSENENHKPLNPVERATAIENMIRSFGWTHQVVGEKLRLDRATVTNLLRLLKLPDETLNKVEAGELSMRQAMGLVPFFELTQSEQDTLLADPDFADFLPLAHSGQINSDTIREKVTAAIAIVHPEPAQFDFMAETAASIQAEEVSTLENTSSEGGSTAESQPVWLQKDIEGNDVTPVMDPEMVSAQEEPKEQVIPEGQPELPAERTSVMTPAAPVENVPVVSPSTPVPATEPAKPVSWAESNYTITLGFMAEDGNEQGRAVVITARRGEGIPKFLPTREKALNWSMPWQVEQLKNQLHPEDFTAAESPESEPAATLAI